jgi:pyridoxine 5-phosphate synthase
MTHLSINVNKIALLRNSRGRNYPDVRAFADRCLALGAHGITLHPRPDQRHARYSDVPVLKTLCQQYGRELNVEGNPTREFLDVVIKSQADQCTLVPDDPTQLTSDHGWNVHKDAEQLRPAIKELKNAGIRVSLFMDFDSHDIPFARELGADRIELYTEPYAELFGSADCKSMVDRFSQAAATAQRAGLGVNAGHDLSLDNLAEFLKIPKILEVSIGHAFVVECLEHGIESVMQRYLKIVNNSA